MRKFSLMLATAGLTASLGAYAAVPTDAQPYQVVVPNLNAGIEVLLEGLLLRPTNSDLDYATVSSLPLASGDDNLTINNSETVNQVNPHYNFGFRVGLGYIFPDSGNDATLQWTHFNKSTSSTAVAGPGQEILTIGGQTFENPTFQPFSKTFFDRRAFVTNNGDPQAASSAQFKYDAIDLDAGQYIDIGTRFRTRLFAGLRFARVENNVHDSYNASYFRVSSGEGQEVTGVYNLTENDYLDSKFTGLGPHVGFDTSYHLGSCFGFVGHFAGSLLAGSVKTTTNQVYYEQFLPNPTQSLTDPSQTTNNSVNTSNNSFRVVPAFDAKLGLDYTYIMPNQSELSLEVGYQWTQYVDAVDRFDSQLVAAPLVFSQPGISDATNTFVASPRTTSGVGFNGPYITVNWKV